MSSESSSPQPLEYLRPRGSVVPKGLTPESLLRLALVSALAPALLGISALAGYWITENDLFMFAGLFVLLLGGIGFLTGIGLTIGATTAVRRRDPNDRRFYRRALLVGVIVIACVPLALGCVFVGNYLIDHPMTTFVLTNKGGQAIDRGVAYFGSTNHAFGLLAPGASTAFKLRLNGNGRFAVDLTSSGKTSRTVVFGSADNDDLPHGYVCRLDAVNGTVTEK